METPQICTISFFQFKGLRNKWWAFTQMGKRSFINKNAIDEAISPSFIKMFGAGAGNGFSLMPDFGVYGLLAVWKDCEDAHTFFATNEVFKSYWEQADSCKTYFLNPLLSHGFWDNKEPFNIQSPLNLNTPIAVLTRGSVKTRYIIDFLRFTRTTSISMENALGRYLTIGIGEVPITQQATFSIWKDWESMMDYAYKNPYHTQVIKKTRELGWYSEELFARFELIKMAIWDKKLNITPLVIESQALHKYFTKADNLDLLN